METNYSYLIPEINLAVLQERIAKLNKKAVKLGCTPIELIIDKEHPEYVKDLVNPIIKHACYPVIVIGEAPKFEDWLWQAAIINDTLTGVATIRTQAFSGVDSALYLDYLKTPTRCEHCGINRVRKNTYIVKHVVTGEVKQVGSSCVKDFTGHTNPEAIASFYESLYATLRDIEEHDTVGHFDSNDWVEFDAYLLAVAFATERFGFFGTHNTEDKQSTSSAAWHLIHPDKDDIKYGTKFEPTEIHKQLAKDALAWIREEIVKNTVPNSFLTNVANIIEGADKTGLIHYRNFAFIAPIVHGYQKTLGISKVNEYVGNVGEKIEFTGKAIKCHWYDTQWGYSCFYTIVDKDGRNYTWNTTQELELHTDYIFNAKVKEHTEYKGTKQTVITRPKWGRVVV